MKLVRTFIIPLIFIIALHFSASAQTDVLNQIITNTGKLHNGYPAEKVYLHFDKPYYAVGDSIWFKAYLTYDLHLPSPISKIIYVDIFGPRDSLIQSLKLQIKNSVSWSFIPLPQSSYKKGNYRVVAYTNWMNNYGPAYFFSKNITIGDAINNDVSTQVSFKTTIVGKAPKISAGIYYKDNEGNPLVGKKVGWSVIRDDDAIFKGRSETDKNGFAEISFINQKNLSLDSAVLATTIEANVNHKQASTIFPLKPVAHTNDIQFFPEGGSLLVGVRTKVAFKAVKSDGRGIDLKGTITDNANTLVGEFSSSHLGMGYFMLTPEDGKSYKVNIAYADGTTASPELPKIQVNGINLALENKNPDLLGIKLQADSNFFHENKDKTFFIICKSSGVICFAAKTALSTQVYSANIPKSKFPTGIVQATLFMADGEPLSERIAFIRHDDLLNINLTSDLPAYTTRQKVKLNVSAKTSTSPVEGNFSVTVVDEEKVPFDENAETTILTYSLLTSDIKGYIEKPNYYFNHPTEKTNDDLDILMQTQGYRRFSYDGILEERYPPITFIPEQGINISGTLRGSTGIPINKGSVAISIPDKNFYQNAITDADGKFKFSNLVFLDSAKVKLSARGNIRASDLEITIDNEPSQKIGINYNAPDEVINIDSLLKPYLKNSKIQFENNHVLKEVVIKDTKIVPKVSHLDYGSLSSLSSQPDHLIDGKDLIGCNSVLECLKSMAMGMTFADNNFYVQRDYSAGNRTPTQVFVRGQPVDVTFLATANPAEIESVEIFLKDQLGLVNSAYQTNGAIVVNMKKVPVGEKISLQQLKNMLPQKNEITYNPQGYSPVRIFYMPRYEGPKSTQTTKQDRRTTIYWNPNVVTDKTGAASVEFYNSDGRGTYRAIIEGIDKDGNIGRQVYKYTVK